MKKKKKKDIRIQDFKKKKKKKKKKLSQIFNNNVEDGSSFPSCLARVYYYFHVFCLRCAAPIKLYPCISVCIICVQTSAHVTFHPPAPF